MFMENTSIHLAAHNKFYKSSNFRDEYSFFFLLATIIAHALIESYEDTMTNHSSSPSIRNLWSHLISSQFLQSGIGSWKHSSHRIIFRSNRTQLMNLRTLSPKARMIADNKHMRQRLLSHAETFPSPSRSNAWLLLSGTSVTSGILFHLG